MTNKTALLTLVHLHGLDLPLFFLDLGSFLDDLVSITVGSILVEGVTDESTLGSKEGSSLGLSEGLLLSLGTAEGISLGADD